MSEKTCVTFFLLWSTKVEMLYLNIIIFFFMYRYRPILDAYFFLFYF